MTTAQKRNSISGQFAARTIEMLESPAYRVLSRAGHMVLSRIEIELGSHGGNDNDNLPVTKDDFIAYGIHHNAVAPAVREVEALGFIRLKRGRGGNAEHRMSSRFGLTYAQHRNTHRSPPTDEWRRIKTTEDAKNIADLARQAKDEHAASLGKRSARKRKQKTNPGTGKGSGPVPKTGTGNGHFPVPETGTTGRDRKPVLLSISGAGVSTASDAGNSTAAKSQNPKPEKLNGHAEPAGRPLTFAELRQRNDELLKKMGLG